MGKHQNHNQIYAEMWQYWAVLMLSKEGYQVELMHFFNPGYDLLVSGRKWDVKVSPVYYSYFRPGKNRGYRFTIDKIQDDIEYLLICDNGLTLFPDCYLVPGPDLKKRITTGRYVHVGFDNYEGKFSKFKFAYDQTKGKDHVQTL